MAKNKLKTAKKRGKAYANNRIRKREAKIGSSLQDFATKTKGKNFMGQKKGR